MAVIRKDVALDYDNVLLVPQYSEIPSRSEVDLTTVLSYNKRDESYLLLDNPILSSNMDTITSLAMAKRMGQLGCGGVLHRYQSPRVTLAMIESLVEQTIYPIIPSIGVDSLEGFSPAALASLYHGAGADAICIDIAHGHCQKMIQTIKEIVQMNHSIHIIAGNVATAWGAFDLADAGATCIKIGIGGGSQCRTRTETACGVPQLAAVLDVNLYPNFKRLKIPTIGDGGIRTTSDIVKCLAAGANMVMLGNMLSGTDECPDPTMYRGMASRSAQLAWKGKASHIEGAETVPVRKGPVDEVIRHILDGVQSGLSYCGTRTIEELWDRAEFVEVHSTWPHPSPASV